MFKFKNVKLTPRILAQAAIHPITRKKGASFPWAIINISLRIGLVGKNAQSNARNMRSTFV